MLQEVLDVLAAVEPQGIFYTVQIQTSTLGIDGKVVSVRRKSYRFPLYRVWIAKVRQPDLAGDGERLLRLLRRYRRTDGREVQKSADQDLNNLGFIQAGLPLE